MNARPARVSSETHRGFTLIEILVVIGMLAILATVVLVAINPLRQFAQARNSQRQANVSALLNAISERIADNRGMFTDADGSCAIALPATATDIKKSGGYDLRPCLVPTYIAELPYDPSTGNNTCSEDAGCVSGSYDTGYTVIQEATSTGGRITVCAPAAIESALPGSTSFCLTR